MKAILNRPQKAHLWAYVLVVWCIIRENSSRGLICMQRCFQRSTSLPARKSTAYQFLCNIKPRHLCHAQRITVCKINTHQSSRLCGIAPEAPCVNHHNSESTTLNRSPKHFSQLLRPRDEALRQIWRKLVTECFWRDRWNKTKINILFI